MEYIKTNITEMDLDESKPTLKIDLEGYSKMPFWNQDLHIRAAIALLNNIDIKRFHEENMEDEYFELLDEVEELVKSLKSL